MNKQTDPHIEPQNVNIMKSDFSLETNMLIYIVKISIIIFACLEYYNIVWNVE